MQKRTDSEWQHLLCEYQQSGLTQKAFCQQKKICPKGLSRYQRSVKTSALKSGFIQALPSHSVTEKPVKVEMGMLTIYLPLDQPLQAAQLIKALQ